MEKKKKEVRQKQRKMRSILFKTISPYFFSTVCCKVALQLLLRQTGTRVVNLCGKRKIASQNRAEILQRGLPSLREASMASSAVSAVFLSPELAKSLQTPCRYCILRLWSPIAGSYLTHLAAEPGFCAA